MMNINKNTSLPSTSKKRLPSSEDWRIDVFAGSLLAVEGRHHIRVFVGDYKSSSIHIRKA